MFEALVLKPTGQTVGLNQKVDSTQYGYIDVVSCAKCNGLVGTQSAWRDKDNSVRHLGCLSNDRILELESMSQKSKFAGKY